MKHLSGISFLTFTWTDTITNMSSIFFEIRMFDMMTDLYGSKYPHSINEKKKCRKNSTMILCEIIICYLEELFEIFSTKKCSWGHMSSQKFLMVFPLIHEFDICIFMRNVGKFEVEHYNERKRFLHRS